MTSGKIWRRGRRRKRVQTCFLPKTPPPPTLILFPPSLVPFARGLRNETKKMSVYTSPPPHPPQRTGNPAPIFSSLDMAMVGYGPRITPKKKEKLVGLVGWFVSFPYSFINHRHFFFLMFWWFGVLSSNCSFAFFVHLQLSWYSVYTGSFSQCSDFLRFCDFCEFVEKNKQEKKKLQGMFCVAYELWLIANVENIGDVLVPVWSLYDRLVDILHLRERRSDGSVSKSFERDISKSFEP